jgi:eukaryotic-like serine/threonine-protein kinase
MVFDKLKQMFGGETRLDVKQRFKVLSQSGMGSMSKVFKVRDTKLGQVVCLKVLDKEKTAAFEKRFIGLKKPGEGAISLELKHPHIVQTFEHGLTIKDEPYLVQEWIDGSGLQHLIETGGAQLDGMRAQILAQAAEALAYMHMQKYLHRDMCPRNLIVTSTGHVKLIDFGLAIPNTPAFCKPGNRTGTAQYLAPEIIKRSSTDLRVDLYALGITAYETYTGQLPWGKVESLQTLLSHMNTPGADPREHRPDLDEATARFLLKAIERDPARRFQTAAQFRDAVRSLPKL